MVSIIISILALSISAFTIYKLMSFESDTLIADCQNLDIYDDLESRIVELESAVKAHVANIREIDSKVSSLRTEVDELSRSFNNLASTTNNLIPFMDKTRGMVDEINKKLSE